jgi:16S rRNA (guanine527-N7)-methyltransferase
MPELDVTCVDAVAKKSSFIKQVALELKLPNLQAAHSRVEALEAGVFDIVVSRAFASLADFTRLTRCHLAPSSVWLAMKGRHPDDEIAALPADLTVFHVEQLVVPGLAAERCALWIRPSQDTH